MNDNKLVSVIIPAFNAEKFIAETLESVLQQTYAHIEIIIVNDGCIDGTPEILNMFQKSDSRITIIHKSNSGVCDSRNQGLKKAKGDFVIFLDADDIWASSFLEICLHHFNSDPKIHAIYTKGQIINEHSEKLDQFLEAKTIFSPSDILEWKPGFVATPSCTIFRVSKEYPLEEWDVNLSTAADQDYFIRMAAKNPMIAIDEILFYYRIHDKNMHQNIALMESDHIAVFRKAEKMGFFNSFWFKQKCISNLYWILAGSWWKDGNNKTKGLLFIFKALLTNPFSIIKRILK